MKYTLRKADKYFLSFIYAPIIPIILFLSGWWVSLPFYRDNRITIFALTGLAAGILIDILFRRKLINEGYRRSVLLNSVIFLFYSVMGFGFFMGVPVFHPALGIIAGLYIARKSFINGASAVEFCQSIRVCAFFCTIVLFFVCASSGAIALWDPYTGANLKGMFRLDFEITRPMIFGIIFIGGAMLLVAQYLLIIYLGTKAMKYFSRNNSFRAA